MSVVLTFLVGLLFAWWEWFTYCGRAVVHEEVLVLGVASTACTTRRSPCMVLFFLQPPQLGPKEHLRSHRTSAPSPPPYHHHLAVTVTLTSRPIPAPISFPSSLSVPLETHTPHTTPPLATHTTHALVLCVVDPVTCLPRRPRDLSQAACKPPPRRRQQLAPTRPDISL